MSWWLFVVPRAVSAVLDQSLMIVRDVYTSPLAREDSISIQLHQWTWSNLCMCLINQFAMSSYLQLTRTCEMSWSTICHLHSAYPVSRGRIRLICKGTDDKFWQAWQPWEWRSERLKTFALRLDTVMKHRPKLGYALVSPSCLSKISVYSVCGVDAE